MGFSSFRQSSDRTPFACLIAAVPVPYYGTITRNQQSHRKQFSEAVGMAIEKVAQAFLPAPQVAASRRQRKLRSSGPIPASPLAGIDLRPSAISKTELLSEAVAWQLKR